jgi:hypothetical protein
LTGSLSRASDRPRLRPGAVISAWWTLAGISSWETAHRKINVTRLICRLMEVRHQPIEIIS